MYQATQVDNSHIIMYLNYLVTYRLLEDKLPNAEALRKAISGISHCGFQIYNGEQAGSIPGVGTQTKKYIDGILNNKDPSKCGIYDIDQLSYEQKKRLVTITEMDKIPDIGIKRAASYYDAGYNTVEMLKEFLKVNGTQRTKSALEHEGQIERRIPRNKIDYFVSRFEMAINAFNSGTTSFLKYDFGGSYYRGAPDSGDIDIIIWSYVPREVATKQAHLLQYLKQQGILVSDQVSGSIVYQGVGYIDQEYPAVRIDIKALPDLINYHYAMFHLIGPGSFNIRMSDIARSKGLTLGSNGMIVTSTKDPIYVRNQEDIFTILGEPYLGPEERN